MLARQDVFVDPAPVSSVAIASQLTEEEMQEYVGGNPFVIVIVVCGGRLGSATVITVGTVVVTVVD